MASSPITSMISKKIVKPFSPTPSSNRRYNLSLLDRLASNEYASIAFFYPKSINDDDPAKISQVLEESLSKALTYYYPFAGTIRDNAFVDCNDMGAEFLNVQVHCSMSDVLNCNDTISAEYCAFPQGMSWGTNISSFEGRILIAQLTQFACGGVAVSTSISHKVVDGHSLTNFINDWAAIARDETAKPSPLFNGESFFPPNHNVAALKSPAVNKVLERHVTKRYLFPASTLHTLKAKVSSESGIKDPTRVEIVAALLHKCAAAARRAKSGGSFQKSALVLFANLRPPLPVDTVGNALAFIVISINEEADMELPRLIAELRKGKENFRNSFNTINPNELVSKEIESINELKQKISSTEGFPFYRCSSLCNFPCNTIDFGWGRPHRVTLLGTPFEFFLLMDNQSGDGVEALVSLEEGDMTFFKEDQELLEFARWIPLV